MVSSSPDLPAIDADGDLHPVCPRCGYNLTGLPEPRCPECGTPFSWDEVRQEARFPTRIAFERARGIRKVPRLFVTALTVLFAPWIFARQAVQRVRTGHALVFGAVCFASTFLWLLWIDEIAFVLAWLLTALIYVLIQAILLAMIDFGSWQRGTGGVRWWLYLRATHFWLLIGCYTSAVMMTELRFGPPMLVLSDVLDVLRANRPQSIFNDLFVYLRLEVVLMWAQLGVWITAIGFCMAARNRRYAWLPGTRWVFAMLAMVTVFVLYAAVVEHIGIPIGEWVYEQLG